MINAQSSFIPLFFDEAETDLWLALQRIEPEKRSSFIKAVLRQVLLEEQGADEFILMKETQNSETSASIDEICEVNKEITQVDSTEHELEDLETFSLDSLFEVTDPVPDTKQQLGEYDLESFRENKPIHSAGLEYILNQIIGTEEDEAVLEVLRGFSREKGQQIKAI